MFTVYVFRYEKIAAEPLLEAISTLEKKTVYRRPALREDAPQTTDCLTAIWYLFKTAFQVDIPITYIGDMPRKLIAFGDWKVLQIDIDQLRCGDLVFVKNRAQAKLLSHVAMSLGNGKLFHAASEARTAVVEPVEEFFGRYEQKLGFAKMVAYIDPRNKELREAYQGKFIS